MITRRLFIARVAGVLASLPLVRNVIASRVKQSIETAFIAIERHIEVCNGALELLKNYESIEDVPLRTSFEISWTRISSSASTAGF